MKYERIKTDEFETTVEKKAVKISFLQSFIIWIVLLTIVLTYISYASNQEENINYHDSSISSLSAFLTEIKNSKDSPNKCEIGAYDIWDKQVMDHIHPNNKEAACTPTYDNHYVVFQNETLSMHALNGDSFCKYQCSLPKNDWHYRDMGWINVTKNEPNCDVFRVECNKITNASAITFQDIFLQIKKIDSIPKLETNFLKKEYNLPLDIHNYSVHMIIVDSLSHYHSVRALNLTRKVLLEDFGGIEMKLVNKIADNSRPNAYGFWFNKQELVTNDVVYGRPPKPSDFGTQNACRISFDNSTFILKYYAQRGYMTMVGEDWDIGAINWADCTGFSEQNGIHTSHPYELLKYDNKMKVIYKGHEKNRCIESYHYQLAYLESFLKTYQDQKRFSYTWLTNLLHDYLDPMFISDKYFAKFFKDNEKRLENSFVFLMADHGHRISGFAKTKMGGFESNNPSLMMTVPKALRSNKELMKNLRDNANKHKSHFDTYATMLDIITEAGRTGFKNLTEFDLTSVVQSDTIKGKSLFRPIHEEDRDCYSMNIPSQFCLCEPKFSPVEHVHQNILNALKSAFVTELNMKLDNDGLRLKCAKMVLNPDKPFIIEYVMGKSKRIVFKITATTLPGNAEYKAFINENMKLEDSNIIRLNHYAEQAEVCEKKSTFRRFCYCKSLIKTIS